MKISKKTLVFTLFVGVAIGLFLPSRVFHHEATAETLGYDSVEMYVFRGTTNENGRVSIPHDFGRTGECEGMHIVGMTAAVASSENTAWYVPGDNTWVEGRTFMAWDTHHITVQIDDDEDWYSNQDVYVVVFVAPLIC